MNICAVVLAAGKGKRMRSLKPKVLHEVLGSPMINYTLEALTGLKPKQLILVVGKEEAAVKNAITNKSVLYVKQKKTLGTGNALLEAKKALRGLKNTTILVINGDSPLITQKTLKDFLKKHKRNNNDLSFLSFTDSSSSGYGRVLRNSSGKVAGIVEDKHARTKEHKNINELNGGVYALKPGMMHYLNRLKKHASSGEYYLTDLVEIASRAGKRIDAYNCAPEETRGINNRAELGQAVKIINKRSISRLLGKGVTFMDPSSSIVHPSVSIGRDTVIYPNTYLEGNTSIGRNCTICPGVRICSSILENGVIVKDNTLIEESTVRAGSILGPCAHLRPQSIIGRKVKIGNFVEIKKSTIGDGTTASHLTYIGDAVVGNDVNIGAGTITCNYDGMKKHATVIKSGVFIGSDSQIVAPVIIGRKAYIAAGTTVTKDVPDGMLAISRTRQKNIKNWARRKRVKN